MLSYIQVPHLYCKNSEKPISVKLSSFRQISTSSNLHVTIKHTENDLGWSKPALWHLYFRKLHCMSHSQCHFIYCHNPAVSFILVCQITQRCPAKHFLPLTHSLKELAAIISRSDQRQRHGRVTPSVHNQRTIHFKGQGNGCSYIRAKRKSHWDILLPLKWCRRKCS